MKKVDYIFPLSIQLPPTIGILENSVAKELILLRKYGFTGVELNLMDLEGIDPFKLKEYLADYGLKMTMFASGALAHKNGLTLSCQDPSTRAEAVRLCRRIIEYAAQLGAGVIFGFIKGGAQGGKEEKEKLFQESLADLNEEIIAYKVPVLIEATNHYESVVANTVAEAVNLIRIFDNPYLKVLPDTYHMNIEEKNSLGSLVKYQGFYQSIHISDNNRLFPGLGALDFFYLIDFLVEIGYQGALALEGNIQKSFARDLEASLKYLAQALQQKFGEG